MKKLVLCLILGFMCINFAYSQNKHQKPEDYVTVKAGNWGFGFQSTLLNRSDITFQSGLTAKYFVSDNWALRFNLRFGRDWAKGPSPEYIVGEEYDDDYDYDYDYDYDDEYDAKDKDLTTIRKSNFMFVIGAEHRHKLSNRFFGYYGADLGVGGYGQLCRYRDNNGTVESVSKQNRSVDVAIQPFIGIECFLGPRISLGFEAGYDILFKFYSKNTYHNYDDDAEKFRQYNTLASHIDFGNVVFGTAKLTYYF